jgi:hypothetical protein
LAEALLQAAPGAVRALVVDGSRVLEAHLEREDSGPLPGALHVGRLVSRLGPRGIARLACGTEVLVQPLPEVSEGGLLCLEVTRMALPEAGRPRLARARPVAGTAVRLGEISPGPALAERLRAAGHKVRTLLPRSADMLEAAGWGEVLEEAETGHLHFAGGMLTITPTPALVAVDIDGTLPPPALAEAGCVPLVQAIRRLGLAGSIVVDFPTLRGESRKALDRTLAAALKAHLPGPCEVTAVNGYGLVQIVRPHVHAGLMMAARLPGHAALELLRRAVRGIGPATLTGPPAMIDWLAARPHLLAEVERARGGTLHLRSQPGLATSAAHVG